MEIPSFIKTSDLYLMLDSPTFEEIEEMRESEQVQIMFENILKVEDNEHFEKIIEMCDYWEVKHLPWSVLEYIRVNRGLNTIQRSIRAVGKIKSYMFVPEINALLQGCPYPTLIKLKAHNTIRFMLEREPILLETTFKMLCSELLGCDDPEIFNTINTACGDKFIVRNEQILLISEEKAKNINTNIKKLKRALSCENLMFHILTNAPDKPALFEWASNEHYWVDNNKNYSFIEVMLKQKNINKYIHLIPVFSIENYFERSGYFNILVSCLEYHQDDLSLLRYFVNIGLELSMHQSPYVAMTHGNLLYLEYLHKEIGCLLPRDLNVSLISHKCARYLAIHGAI